MKRCFSMLVLCVLVTALLCPAASASVMGDVGVNYRMELLGDYIPAPVSSSYTVSGQKLSDGYQHIFTRFGKFAIAHDCQSICGSGSLWTVLAASTTPLRRRWRGWRSTRGRTPCVSSISVI